MKGGKVLVTGASGYIGSAVAGYLQGQGYEVTGTYRKTVGEFPFRAVKADLSQAVELEGAFDVIVHAAGERPGRKSEQWAYDVQDFNSFKHNNVDAMENIINFARTHSVKRVINLSSIGIYGQIKGGVLNEESDRINPDAYGITKYMGEMILKECGFVKGISLRMPGVIGPGASGVWLTNVAEKLKKGEDITIYTPDFRTGNFVWIEDLSKFIGRLIELEEWKYDTLVLACRKGASIREIVGRIKELAGSSSKIQIDDSLRQPFRIDASRAFEMGYESLEPLEMVERYL